jgi:hypothetical protein
MKLEDYVAESLKEIISGVVKAQNYAKDNGAQINPNGMGINNLGQPTFNVNARQVLITGQMIDFDIVVSVTEGDQAKVGAGLFVGPVGLGAQGQVESSNSAVNRIKFCIPVFLPVQ